MHAAGRDPRARSWMCLFILLWRASMAVQDRPGEVPGGRPRLQETAVSNADDPRPVSQKADH